MAIVKEGRQITSLADWECLAPPRQPNQWVDGRSAKEVARAWLESGENLPTEVHEALANHSMFGRVTAWCGEPEARLPFDEFGGETRNTDLKVVAEDKHGKYILAVEAKADEPFSGTVADAFADALERRIANPRSNGIARIELLTCRFLRPRTGCAAIATDLRYQLLTACAGAVAEAERHGVARAVMMVHEFITSATSDANHQRNAADLARFLARLGEHSPAAVIDGQLYGPFTPIDVPGIKLLVGKVTRNIRLGVPNQLLH